MSDLIISKRSGKTDICVLENGSICEIYSYQQGEESILGNIYTGRVKDVVNGMQAAFIDIGLEKNAFISIKDAIKKIDVTKEEQNIDFKISDVLKPDDKVLVQVRKVPTSIKGARVSTHITIPGNYVVLMPNTNIITASQKIEDKFERERLIKIVKNAIPEGFGAIVRTDAENIEKEKIQDDLEELVKKWKNICNMYEKDDDIQMLYNEHEFISKISRDLINKQTSKIYVNDDEILEELKETIGLCDVKFELIKPEDIFESLGLVTEFENAHKRKIWLKCGGYIVIDKTEALTAIDVNSGKYVGNKSLEETALNVNKEAAIEIMKQIRLRDIGGIIVIDFIDLLDKNNQAQILDTMIEEARKDRSKIDIKGYTELNLVELTRKTVNI